MTTREYAAAQLPDAPEILGVALQPFCIGHALLLERYGSPFAYDALRACGGVHHTEALLGDLILALEICRLEPFNIPQPGKLNSLKRRQAGVRAPQLHLACMAFANYVQASFKAPKTWTKTASHSKPSGVPLLATLKLGLMARLRKTEPEALRTPVHLALFDLTALNAAHGHIDLITEEHQALMDMATKSAADKEAQAAA